MAEATFLARIVAATRIRLAERMAATSIDALRAEAAHQPPALDFAAALRPTDGGVRAIAEFKRASPSKGTISIRSKPQSIAHKYIIGGAAAISVLTERDFFKGSLDDLRVVATVAHASAIPILRKDFITDPYQVVEARATGADSYLLIVALLDDPTLATLIQVGRDMGMEPLVEAHDAEETRRAVQVGAQIIGINARDLRTFAVDTTLLKRLRPLIPTDRIVIAESGIATMADVVRLRGYGAQAILVGEALMRAEHPDIELGYLIGISALIRRFTPRTGPIIKLCGMRTRADARAAVAAGADMIGLVFAPSKRQVDVAQAQAIIAHLPPHVLAVGVFGDEPLALVQKIYHTVGLGAVQIAEDLDFPESVMELQHPLGIPVLVTMQQPAPDDLTTGYADPLVIDSAPPGIWGGTGQTGDWERATNFAQSYPIILAGGLTPANVGAAIRQVNPWGVDVSSGIEGPDGQKDPARMRAFVQAVRVIDEIGHGGLGNPMEGHGNS